MERIFYILSITVFIIFSSCGSEEKQDPEQLKPKEPIAQTNEPDDTTTYHATGVVKSIPPNKKMVIIRHEKIPGFMDKMTMPFSVKDSSLLQQISPDDSVRFTIESVGSKITITDIVKIE